MPPTIYEYLSSLKKKHYDDLSDYSRGRLDGSVSAHLAWFTLDMGCMLFFVWKCRYR